MKSDEERFTVFSAFPRVDDRGLPESLVQVSIANASHAALTKAYLAGGNDTRCFLFNGLSRQVWTIALLKMLFPNTARKLVVVDMILSPPSTLRDRVALSVQRSLLAKVDLFISYAVNTRGIREIYRIPQSRFVYVPFKVNDWDLVENLETADDGYVFVGGQTRRDFATLLRAIEHLPVPVRLVARTQSVLSQHGSVLVEDGWPEHVVFVRDANTREDFLREIARARLVVLPIVEENITPSGIGVCLVAMALRKCVIISSGPAADGLVDSGQALIVPAGDWEALREAISNAWANEGLRAATAQRGFAYAMALGNEKRLHRDIFENVVELCRGDIG